MEPIVVDREGNPVRICSFCRRSGDASKEHLLASQWRQHFPEWGDQDAHDWGWIVDVDGQTLERNKVHRTRGAFTRTAPRGVVCNTCNNGWMNRLEEKAIPILLPMAKGESPALNAWQVRVLDHWIAKTAVVAELMDEGGKAVSFFLTGVLKDITPGTTSPQSFFSVVKAIEPYPGSNVRSSIFTLIEPRHDCTGHHVRAATIIVGAVALVTVYSADAMASGVIMDTEPWRYLGDPAWNGQDGWSLDRSESLAVGEALRLNDAIGENLRRAWLVHLGVPADPTL